MKLAVLADIHANWPALQAVADHIETWQPDHVIVAGDVVNRGPRPLECLNFVQQKGWPIVRGNHEEYVMTHAEPDSPRNGPQFEIWQGSFFTYRRLNEDMAALEAMPLQLSRPAPDGSQIRVTHASMLGTRVGIYQRTTDEELADRVGQSPPTLFCVGHTHLPLVRSLDGTLVVNVGAVGLPFDGDVRAAYAQLTWRGGTWRAEIVRLDYDRAQAGRDFYAAGFLDEAPAFARLVQVELQTARSRVYEWTKQYEARVLAGEMTMAASVQEFLA